MLSPWPDSETIGVRVVVRYRTGAAAASGRPELTDVIGYVREADPDSLRVERRDGVLVRVRRSDAVAWKPVPEPPERRAGSGSG